MHTHHTNHVNPSPLRTAGSALLLVGVLLVSIFAVTQAVFGATLVEVPPSGHAYHAPDLRPDAVSHENGSLPTALDLKLGRAIKADGAQDFKALAQNTEDLSALSQELLRRINEERSSRGLASLIVNALLNQAAQLHSEDLASRDIQSHTGSDGSGPGERIRRVGYLWDTFGENVGLGGPDAGQIIAAWLNDPSHRVIMLSTTFRDFGAGVARSATDRYYFVANFAAPFIPSPAPPPVTKPVGPEGGVIDVGGGTSKDGGASLIGSPGTFPSTTNVTVAVTNSAPSGVTASGAVLLPKTVDVTTDTGDSLGRAAEISINLSSDEFSGIKVENIRGAVVIGEIAEPRPTRIINAAEGIVAITVDHFTKFTLFAITNSGPNIIAPSDNQTLQSFGTTLSWSPPLGTTQFQLQVVPFNNDGPGVNLIQNAASSFTLPAPPDWYGLLPDMTYFWRIRTTTVTTFPTEKDWSAWSSRIFRTPKVSATNISVVTPPPGSAVPNLMPTLGWADANPQVFYYEVQVSKDESFNTDPATATAMVYWVLVHGGVTTPTNSYEIPGAFPLEAGTTYYWRVRPRVQGDGLPVSWSQTWKLSTQP